MDRDTEPWEDEPTKENPIEVKVSEHKPYVEYDKPFYDKPFYDKPFEAEDTEWEQWSKRIEIKLSTQGKVLVGLGGVIGLTLALSIMQGKVVLNLVKGFRELVPIVNHLSGGIMDGTTTSNGGGVSYAAPAGHIDESKIEPVDETLSEELKQRLENVDPDADGEGLR